MLLSCACLAASAAQRVFLTFDDGPIDATLDVLDVLKAHGVKATFFVNGIHLAGDGGEREGRAGEALRRTIAEGHVVANHSHDHMAHNRPPGVYAIKAASAFRDVETDRPFFVPRNVEAVEDALAELAGRPNNRIGTLARLPYSNLWMVPDLPRPPGACGRKERAFWHPDACANADEEVSDAGERLAEALFQRHGMPSIGWDFQWRPVDWTAPDSNEGLPPAAFAERAIVDLMEDGRHCVTAGTATRCHGPVVPGNIVVLTHDFLFEDGPRGRGKDANLAQLGQLIAGLKARGYAFDTLDRFAERIQEAASAP